MKRRKSGEFDERRAWRRNETSRCAWGTEIDVSKGAPRAVRRAQQQSSRAHTDPRKRRATTQPATHAATKLPLPTDEAHIAQVEAAHHNDDDDDEAERMTWRERR